MPSARRTTKEQIAEAAFALVRREGIEALNARRLASELGCSTQPILYRYTGMKELKKDVTDRAYKLYGEHIATCLTQTERPFLASGVGYITFSVREKPLFRLLFMRNRAEEQYSRVSNDPNLPHILDCICASAGIGREEAQRLHLHLWLFAHGIATMSATGFLTFTDDEITELLYTEFTAHVKLIKSKEKGE